MIVDLATDDRRELPEYDVCVIGSGPAGGTVASELADSGLRVCVVESGRRKNTRYADELKRVVSDGLPIKDYSRERVLGGASTTWAGLSAPLDPIDMQRREWLRLAGWPIEREQLEPYWEAAAARFAFPTAEFFGPSGFGRFRAESEVRARWDQLEEKVFLALDPPQRFGKLLRSIYESERVDLYLDASVSRLAAGGDGPRVTHAELRPSDGRTLLLRAKRFVVACGGIENARLLLLSTDLHPAGLGNDRDQVGRCLMNHPKNYHGMLHLRAPVKRAAYFFGCLFEGFAGYAGLRLTEDEQRRRGLLNSYVRFEPMFPWSGNDGVESAVLLAKRSAGLLQAWKRRQKGPVELRDYSETGDDSDLQNARKGLAGWAGVGWNVVRHSPSVANYTFHRLSKAAPAIRRVRLRNFMEMEPDPQNRVTLAEERDAAGNPIPRVAHRCTELDQRSLVELHRVLADELERSGVGHLETTLADETEWPITQDASHHIGTTRMGTDPSSSVVDANQRVHGVDNVYLAGASVFPTSGCANPTFTIVALSIRLAEHLRSSLASPREVARP
ncbi:FAD-dependent oxidoreductase [Engelhardtia mirabilis]|uniref:Fructose dehydrogenase large subunit n=1 Tax=Engelhardtia mirabilis TaxID=2528011 RepID=A0A518BNH2_9BACT|nr:Fructose dehydrogenase large subunit [Planctomycetes bacterium Pla133]QDV02853.1 Fructose dehydrogenase large subunit [Planctomycetes bacterium Pla86]